MAPTDLAARLPVLRTLVHSECYTRAVGHPPALRLTVEDYVREAAA